MSPPTYLLHALSNPTTALPLPLYMQACRIMALPPIRADHYQVATGIELPSPGAVNVISSKPSWNLSVSCRIHAGLYTFYTSWVHGRCFISSTARFIGTQVALPVVVCIIVQHDHLSCLLHSFHFSNENPFPWLYPSSPASYTPHRTNPHSPL